MKKLIPFLLLMLFGLSAQAQVSAKVQPGSYKAGIALAENLGLLAGYSTQNNLGNYLGIGLEYTRTLPGIVNPVISIDGQYMLGTYKQAPSFRYNRPQTEFEIVFSYSAFAGIRFNRLDVGISINHHFGKNRDIWITPTAKIGLN